MEMINKIINCRYQICNFFISGNANDVYEAFDIFFKRKVIIKFLKQNNEDGIYHIINEVKNTNKININSVIKMYELGIFEKKFYNVSEFIDGISIRKIIVSKKKKNFLEKCQIILKICESLSFIHKKGIIHRDIKPDNIYYLKDKTIKIIDFGISSNVINKNKNDLKLMGSVCYLSPENVYFGIVNVSNDIYALGILAYELFYNALPFFKETDSVSDIVEEINKKLEFNDQLLPKEINYILIKSTKKNYRERYISVDEMKKDLERFLNNESINFS